MSWDVRGENRGDSDELIVEGSPFLCFSAG